MKQPNLSRLTDKDMLFVYAHDKKKQFNEDERDFLKFQFETRRRFLLERIENMVRSGIILDVGCAQGNYTLTLASGGYLAIGLDIRRSFLKYALWKGEPSELRNVAFVVANAERMPFRDNVFDCVMLGEILEHLSHPQTLIKEALRTLKNKGIIVITTPNGEAFRSNAVRFKELENLSKDLVSKIECMADTHVFNFTKNELIEAVKKEGFTVEDFSYLLLLVPPFFPHIYRIPLPLEIIRKIETKLLNINFLGKKLARELVLIGKSI